MNVSFFSTNKPFVRQFASRELGLGVFLSPEVMTDLVTHGTLADEQVDAERPAALEKARQTWEELATAWWRAHQGLTDKPPSAPKLFRKKVDQWVVATQHMLEAVQGFVDIVQKTENAILFRCELFVCFLGPSDLDLILALLARCGSDFDQIVQVLQDLGQDRPHFVDLCQDMPKLGQVTANFGRFGPEICWSTFGRLRPDVVDVCQTSTNFGNVCFHTPRSWCWLYMWT